MAFGTAAETPVDLDMHILVFFVDSLPPKKIKVSEALPVFY